jgi:hypothetical protein
VAFKTAIYDLKTEWYKALDGVISVPVYKDSVPLSENGNYVLIRSEGSTSTELNNSAFFQSAIIIVDIFTKFANIGNSKTAYDIAQEIDDEIILSPNSFGITLPNHQITQITVQSETELYEDDGAEKTFRVIIRYEIILNQN